MMSRAMMAAAFACLLGAGLVRHASAEQVDALTALDAPVEFRAEYSVSADDQTWRGTVVHAPGRERRDFATALGTQAVLLRRDIDQAAVLWPQRKWYLTTSLRALAGIFGGPDGIKLDRRRDGKETVGDERCMRWIADGGFSGRLWYSADGILIRAAGVLRVKGHETSVVTQLARIRRIAVDPDEFELPLGYRGLPVSPALLGEGD